MPFSNHPSPMSFAGEIAPSTLSPSATVATNSRFAAFSCCAAPGVNRRPARHHHVVSCELHVHAAEEHTAQMAMPSSTANLSPGHRRGPR